MHECTYAGHYIDVTQTTYLKVSSDIAVHRLH